AGSGTPNARPTPRRSGRRSLRRTRSGTELGAEAGSSGVAPASAARIALGPGRRHGRRDLSQRHGADLARLPGEQPAVVVHLAEVIGEVGDDVEQEVSGRHGEPGGRLRVRLLESRLGEARHTALYRRDRGVDFPQQLRPRYVPPRELGVAVAHVARPRQHRADEELDVSPEVERQRAGAVADPRCHAPDIPSSAYASISRRSALRSRRKIAAIQVVSMEGSPQRLYGRYSSGNRSFSAPSFGRSLNTMYG